MKKIVLFIALLISLMSCTNEIVVKYIEDGKIISIVDQHSISSIGDTLIVKESNLSRTPFLYGVYVGNIPQSETFKTSTDLYIVNYNLVKRIK